MWIGRSTWSDLLAQMAASRERITQLERTNAGLQTHVDWLTQHVNRLETERGILTSERLRVLYPVPTITRADAEPAPAPVTHGLPADSIPLEQILGTSMEDVGDDVAGRLGVGHDALGNLVFK